MPTLLDQQQQFGEASSPELVLHLQSVRQAFTVLVKMKRATPVVF